MHREFAPRVVGEREPANFDPLGDEAGIAVRMCEDLSEADKFAWAYLRTRTNSGRQLVKVSPEEVGRYYGRSKDAGRQRLKNLQAKSFIASSIDHNGDWLIQLLDPLDVLNAVVRVVAADPQRVLPFAHEEATESNTAGELSTESQRDAAGDAPSSPAEIYRDEEPREDPSEVPREEPRRPPSLESLGSLGPSEHLHLSSIISAPSAPLVNRSTAKDQGERGSSRGSSSDSFLADVERRRRQLGLAVAAPAPGNLVESLVPALVREQHVAQQSRARERWIENLKQRVADPNTREIVFVRVAVVLADGRLPVEDLERVLGALKNATSSRGAYFVQSMKREFRQRGLEWSEFETLSRLHGEELELLDSEALRDLVQSAGLDPAIVKHCGLKDPHVRYALLKGIASQKSKPR